MKINTVYIISKGRPQCTTAKTLTKMDYPGEWFIVCGNNDETIPEYQKRWGKDRILIFDWYEEVKRSNLLDNFGVENMSSGAVPVRNATMKIARDRGEIRHWQFDDDYSQFRETNKQMTKNVKCTGKSFEHRLNLIATFAHQAKLTNIGFALGMESFPNKAKGFGSRVFNAHNMPTDEKFTYWKSRMNDDLINAIETYQKGGKEMAVRFLCLILAPTQSEKGGNTDIYQQSGTVRKTAYAILQDPKNVKLVIKYGRYHHKVNWSKIVPKVLRETYA